MSDNEEHDLPSSHFNGLEERREEERRRRQRPSEPDVPSEGDEAPRVATKQGFVLFFFLLFFSFLIACSKTGALQKAWAAKKDGF